MTQAKVQCIGCNKEYTQTTLNKYGGSHCKRCYDKLEGQKACIQCKKLFTIATLNKNDGLRCTKCFKNISMDLNCKDCKKHIKPQTVSKYNGKCKHCYDNVGEKSNCSECKKEYKRSTLLKYGGACLKCSRKSISSTGDKGDSKEGDKKERKRTIYTQTQRKQTWMRRFGNVMEAKCFLCEVTVIDFTTFQMGHDIAFAKNGSDELDNIEPICSTCNRSMKTMTFAEFKKSLMKGKIDIPIVNNSNSEDTVTNSMLSTLMSKLSISNSS